MMRDDDMDHCGEKYWTKDNQGEAGHLTCMFMKYSWVVGVCLSNMHMDRK